VRFGVVILPEFEWPAAASLWRRAEAWGFDHAWTYDHLTWSGLPDSPWFGSVPTLAAAAVVTEHIRLGTYVASPNFRHPVPFAQDLMTLDHVTGGRLVAGLGTGGDLDARLLHSGELTTRQRVDRFTEFVGLLHRLLGAEQVDHTGDYFSAADVRMRPGCVQRPRLPFVVAANGARSMRLAVRYGAGWVTTGRAGADGEQWWTSVADSRTRLEELVAVEGRSTPIDRFVSVDASGLYSLSSVDAFENAVGRAHERGFTDVVFHWPRAHGPYAGREETLERVVSDVLPRWRDA
jgi:alkanesulfonate monooxygenase SsuD/methylene tetrahydromethanopterin reductase-like flavin-dependent oxidoreductase (luciferase family)